MNKHLIYSLKIGDIIICNKSYSATIGYQNKIDYNAGDTFVINTIYDLDKNYTYPIRGINNKNKDYGFSQKELEDNWITLAEWREQQINSILDDI